VGRVLLAHLERALSLEQVGAGLGVVRLDLQYLLIVLDRLGQLALLSERIAPVGVSLGVVRVQGRRAVLDRHGQ